MVTAAIDELNFLKSLLPKTADLESQ